jgi:hypothetical protein
MNNRVNEVRKMIKALRISMMEAEAAMRDQINHDRHCTFVAQDLLNMRMVMAGLVREKQSLGDNEPIVVSRHVPPRAARKPFPVVKPSSVQALTVG